MRSSKNPTHFLPETAKRKSSTERSALFVATLTSFMGPFMISSVNVALPAIQNEMGMTAVELGWVATSYLLAMAVALIPVGKIADIHGRKKIFTLGLVVYTIGSTAAAFAGNTMVFLVLRVVQGVGAALFVTTGMAILTSVFSPQKRGRAIGVYVSAVYVGLSVGPFIGGVMTQQFGWRSIFALMLPLGITSIVVTRAFLKGEWADADSHRLDVPGCLIYGAAIVSLVYGASILPRATGWILVPAGMLGLVLFFLQQRRASDPVFEVTLFVENRTFTFSSLAALLNYSATFAVTFMMSLYLQYIKGMTPQVAGSILMAQPVVMAFFSPLAGRLSDRIQPRLLATAGMSITTVGMVVFTLLKAHSPIFSIVGNLVLLGFGFALFSSPNMSAIMGAVDKKDYGLASGTVATMRLLGQMTSMAIATVVLTFMVGHRVIEPANYGRFMTSVQTVFIVSAVLCTIGIYFSMFRGRLRQ
jgi:EmrB/QacA subfamily drug resistance transporter